MRLCNVHSRVLSQCAPGTVRHALSATVSARQRRPFAAMLLHDVRLRPSGTMLRGSVFDVEWLHEQHQRGSAWIFLSSSALGCMQRWSGNNAGRGPKVTMAVRGTTIRHFHTRRERQRRISAEALRWVLAKISLASPSPNSKTPARPGASIEES